MNHGDTSRRHWVLQISKFMSGQNIFPYFDLWYDRIDVSKVTDVNKTNESCKSIIFNYYYFLKVNFKFQPRVYDLMQRLWVLIMLRLFLLKKMAIEFIFGIWVRIAIDSMNNANLHEKNWIIVRYQFFLGFFSELCIKTWIITTLITKKIRKDCKKKHEIVKLSRSW